MFSGIRYRLKESKLPYSASVWYGQRMNVLGEEKEWTSVASWSMANEFGVAWTNCHVMFIVIGESEKAKDKIAGGLPY